MKLQQKLILALLAALLQVGCGEEKHPMLAGGREVKSWVADLEAPEAKVRRQAVLKLGNVGDADPAVAAALAQALRDRDPLVRHDAVLAVAKLKTPSDEIIDSLRSMARDDKATRPREAAAKALKKFGRAD